MRPRIFSTRLSSACSVVACTSVSSKSSTTTNLLCFNSGIAYAGAISFVLNAMNRALSTIAAVIELSSPPSSLARRAGTATKCNSLVVPSAPFICTTAVLFSPSISPCNASIDSRSSASHPSLGAHRNDGAPPASRDRKCNAGSGSNVSLDSQNPTIVSSPPATSRSRSNPSFASRDVSPRVRCSASPSAVESSSSSASSATTTTRSSATHASRRFVCLSRFTTEKRRTTDMPLARVGSPRLSSRDASM